MVKHFIWINLAILAVGAAAHATDSVSWTLDDVTKIALENNPDLKSARANYEASTHVVTEAISGYLPRVDLTGGVNETTLPAPSTGSLIGTSLPYSAIAVSVNQVLFDFGKVLTQINSASAQRSSAEQDSFAVKNAVTLAVQQEFYASIAGQKLVDAANESVARFQETVRTTGVLVRTGTRPNFDLTQANVELSKAKLGLINAQNTLELSKIALVNVMGLKEQPKFVLIETPNKESITSAQLNLDQLTHKALSFRPEIKRSDFSVINSKENLNGEITNYFPTLSFQGWYGSYQPNYPVELRSAWGLGIFVNWNIFEGLKTSARVSELSARLSQQEAIRDKEQDDITSQVARAYTGLVRAENNLDVANEALASAQENQRLAQKRYERAVATILELLVANTSLVEEEASAIEAKYEREIAIKQLKNAVNAPLVD
jgi:outer membrane protein TolC